VTITIDPSICENASREATVIVVPPAWDSAATIRFVSVAGLIELVRPRLYDDFGSRHQSLAGSQ